MNGIPSYEDRLRNPFLSVIDFEFITLHPEAKAAIWEKYCLDVIFKDKIDNHMKNDIVFSYRFKEAFKSYLNNGRSR